MTTKTPAVGAEPAAIVNDQPAVDADAIRRDATVAAAKAERERVAGIIGAPEAKDRTELAQHLAFNTALSLDEAKAILAKAPVATAAAPAKPANALETAMSKVKNPIVGASVDTEQSEDAQAAAIAGSILTLYRGPDQAAH